MQMTTDEVLEVLEDSGYETRPYSGRCMDGRVCASVTVDSVAEIYKIGLVLGSAANEMEKDAPDRASWDQMGLGYVIYWPGLRWDEE